MHASTFAWFSNELVSFICYFDYFTVRHLFWNNQPIINNHICSFRYEKVLSACSLKQDLEIFTHGDQTEVSSMWILTASR